MESIDNNRERQAYSMHHKAPYTHTLFTARPYLIDEFSTLIDKISEFKKCGLPRNIFMSLKDIFYPFELIHEDVKDLRVDEEGNFVELEKLIKRQIDLNKKHETGIEEFFKEFIEESNSTWKRSYKDKGEKDARRVWHADIIELVEFL